MGLYLFLIMKNTKAFPNFTWYQIHCKQFSFALYPLQKIPTDELSFWSPLLCIPWQGLTNQLVFLQQPWLQIVFDRDPFINKTSGSFRAISNPARTRGLVNLHRVSTDPFLSATYHLWSDLTAIKRLTNFSLSSDN